MNTSREHNRVVVVGGGLGGLATAGFGEFGVTAARVAALARQFGLPVPQQQQAGRAAFVAGPRRRRRGDCVGGRVGRALHCPIRV